MKIQANEPLILMLRAALKYQLNHPQHELPVGEFEEVQSEYDRLGRVVRKMLRDRGYPLDIEIDSKMVQLSEAAATAFRALCFYIVRNSTPITALNRVMSLIYSED